MRRAAGSKSSSARYFFKERGIAVGARVTVGGGAEVPEVLSSTSEVSVVLFVMLLLGAGTLPPAATAAKFPVGIDDGLADVAEHLAGVGDQHAGLLVKALDQLAERDHGRQQVAAIFVAAETFQERFGPGHAAVDGVDAGNRGVDDAGDALAIIRQRCRERFE